MLLNKDDCELASKYIKNTAEDENADAMCEYALIQNECNYSLCFHIK